jgi:hypothetical protein
MLRCPVIADDPMELALAELRWSVRRARALGVGIALLLVGAGVLAGYVGFVITFAAGDSNYSGNAGDFLVIFFALYLGGGGVAGLVVGRRILRRLVRRRGAALVSILAKRHGVAEDDLRAQLTLF